MLLFPSQGSDRNSKVQLHWILNLFSIVAAVGGFGAIYLNKEVVVVLIIIIIIIISVIIIFMIIISVIIIVYLNKAAIFIMTSIFPYKNSLLNLGNRQKEDKKITESSPFPFCRSQTPSSGQPPVAPGGVLAISFAFVVV